MMPSVEHRPQVRAGIAAWLARSEQQQFADLSWAAGLFDGEGCIGSMQSDRRYRQRVTLRVQMASLDGILRLHSVFPFSPIGRQEARAGRVATYKWSCTHIGYVGYVLLMLRPHLTVKRQEADLAIEYLGLADPTPQQTTTFVTALRACKSKPGPWRAAA